MSTITNLKELEEKGTLEWADKIIFTVNEQIIEYKVYSFNLQKDRLSNGEIDNDRIFKILNLDRKEISEKTYGYESKDNSNNGWWPESNNDDYFALTRLVKELYKIIEERKPVYTKYNRFEIMDI